MSKDWVGDIHATMVTLGASNHAKHERAERDYYATEPKAALRLLEVETFNKNIWECACGENHIANVFKEAGYNVRCSDIEDRCCNEVLDFLQCDEKFDGDIITNPPYKYATEFVEKSLELINKGNKVAMFLRIQFLEGKRRRKLYDVAPPKRIYVSSTRLKCAMNGDFLNMTGSAACYAWFVWEKGYKGDSVVKWI